MRKPNLDKLVKMVKKSDSPEDTTIAKIVEILKLYKTCKGISLPEALLMACNNSKEEGPEGELIDLAHHIADVLLPYLSGKESKEVGVAELRGFMGQKGYPRHDDKGWYEWIAETLLKSYKIFPREGR